MPNRDKRSLPKVPQNVWPGTLNLWPGTLKYVKSKKKQNQKDKGTFHYNTSKQHVKVQQVRRVPAKAVSATGADGSSSGLT